MVVMHFPDQQGVEFLLHVGGVGLVDQVVLLMWVGLVVVEQPGAGQVADVGVALGAHAAVFAATVAARPFAEWGGAGDQRVVLRRILAGANVVAVVEAFDSVGAFDGGRVRAMWASDRPC